MSIASAIQNAQQRVANAYTAISNMGGTLPATQNLANMPTAIASIPTGGSDPQMYKIIGANISVSGYGIQLANFVTAYGSPSVDQYGNATFTEYDYYILDNSMKSNNDATYYFEFTYNYKNSNNNFIMHCENFVQAEINSSRNILAYSWGSATLYTMNTTLVSGNSYKLSVNVNGTTKTYILYDSSGTQLETLTFTDTGADPSSNYECRVGHDSISSGYMQNGTINIANSYVKIGSGQEQYLATIV